tara:strand:- start:3 stop:155 length:153 start_codon:yes stop_codon:yes gene_type:complete
MIEFVKDFFGFMMARKTYWLLPILIVFLLIGLVLIFVETSPIAPFIYPLF